MQQILGITILVLMTAILICLIILVGILLIETIKDK